MPIEIVVGGRRSGRTTECIKWAAENDAYIVCANVAEAKRIAEQARHMGLKIKFPVTFDEAVSGMRGSYPSKLAVDNADWFLQAYLGHGIHTVGFATWEATEEQSDD